MWRAIVLAGVLGVVGFAAPADAVFDPSVYGGSWSGTWRNVTFQVDGPISATITPSPDGQTLTVDYTITGLFNCGTTTFSRVLTRGVDFSESGLAFTSQASSWGAATVSSKSTKKIEKIKASGGTTCNSGIASWSVKAKLKATRLKGTMKIVFASGSPKKARTTFRVDKP